MFHEVLRRNLCNTLHIYIIRCNFVQVESQTVCEIAVFKEPQLLCVSLFTELIRSSTKSLIIACTAYYIIRAFFPWRIWLLNFSCLSCFKPFSVLYNFDNDSNECNARNVTRLLQSYTHQSWMVIDAEEKQVSMHCFTAQNAKFVSVYIWLLLPSFISSFY